MKCKSAKRFLATFLFFCVLSSAINLAPANPDSISTYSIFGPMIDNF